MANDVVFTVEGKGKNLKKTANEAGNVGKNVDKSNEALDRASTKQNRYNKQEKGIYQTNLSSGKAYSKLAQTIGGGGSSALVGAYATLAANVFALSAAFNALRNASQFEQLTQGLEAVGDAAGRNLGHLGERLQEITGHAISAERAMKAVAIGTSAGFDAGQLAKLTVVARGASLALGRDMGDAMDRLIRGAAKLEPEILDELGIMVRLDDATETYATTLGKTAGQLTQFERRMGFVNAINEQGLQKFEGIAKAVDPTPYDQLAAAFDGLTKAGLSFVNTFLTPLISLMANSQGVLIGATTLFASTISRQMLPSLHETAARAKTAAAAFAENNTELRNNIVTTGALPKKYKKLTGSIIDGTASLEKMKEVQIELANSEKHRQAMLDKLDPEDEKYNRTKEGLDNVSEARRRYNDVLDGSLGMQAKSRAANAMTMATFGSLRDGWGQINDAVLENNAQIEINAEKQGRSVSGFDKASKAAFKYGNRLKFVGAALVNSIPFIGIAITAIGLLSAAWEKFKPRDPLKEAADEAEKAFERIQEINAALIVGSAQTKDQLVIMKNEYIALAGVVETARDVILDMTQKIRDEQSKALKELAEGLIAAQEASDRYANNEFGTGFLDMLLFGTLLNAGYAKNAADAQVATENQKKAMDDLKKSLGLVTDENIKLIRAAHMTSVAQLQIFSDLRDGAGAKTIEKFANLNIKVGDSLEELENDAKAVVAPLLNYRAAIEGGAQLASNFAKEQVKLAGKIATPYDEAFKQLQAIQNEMQTALELARAETPLMMSRVIDPAGNVSSVAIPNEAAIEKAQKRLVKALIEEHKLKERFGIEDDEQFAQYVINVGKNIDALKKMAGQIKILQIAEKRSASIAKSSYIGRAAATKITLQNTRNRINMQLKELEVDRNTNEMLVENELVRERDTAKAAGNSKLAEEIQEKINSKLAENTRIEGKILALKFEQLDPATEAARVAEAAAQDAVNQLKTEQELLSIAKKRQTLGETLLRNQVEMSNLQDPSKRMAGQTGVNAAQEFDLFAKNQKARKEMIEKEYTFGIKRVDIEWELEKAKMERLKAESLLLAKRLEEEGDTTAMANHEAFVASINSYVNNMGPLITQRKNLLELERNAALSNLNLERERLKVAANRFAQEQFSAGSGSRAAGGGTGVAGVDFAAGVRESNKAYKESIKEREAIRKKAEDEVLADAKHYGMDASNPSVQHAVKTAGDSAVDAAGLTEIDPSMSEKLGQMREMSQGLIDNLKQLGPGGEAAAAVAEGMFTVTQSFASAFETLDSGAGKMEKASAVLGAVGATISAVGGMMKASSDARVAGIDREIAAEKKRDGKSKESLAKIRGLEKKREQEARKGFERNKKMQMASAIISTASAVVGALAWDPKGWWNIPLAAMIGAMGAVQLGLIAGQSYQGGGSGGIQQPQAPAQISMGERNNKVDIAGGRGNAAGEMAYLRGARGFGTSAADFRPAFSGRKYRAAGGAAYVVGEQGPELFVPSVPGRVVSNDDMEAGAAAGNVNFTINAIDAAGVQEVLVEQRGNIIGMLRESANEYGTGFLEEVNEEAYTSTTEGSVYGRA